ncbi:hypothetical protein NHF50_04620 [Flavobacterium sp. NRK F10]|uniref:hypothetical protein n=1 Tax=Flavobacterium sp. NRK F10 TaxID=2954931 RepID=UPI002091C63E|nr:hypothetical protein [Flavobacterium sp. NRK F10]MCO6174322.1 hypothetical protein [Flavobacterium sp. NRK F10]
MLFLLLVAMLAIFTVVSILYQIKGLQKAIQKWDKFGLLPNYCFFAPNPLLNDYRIVFKRINSEQEEWEEVPIYMEFKIVRIFWNPFKYYNKGLIDSCHFLIDEFNVLENKKGIQFSVFYLNILTLISNFLKEERNYKNESIVRFSIVSSKGIKDIAIDHVMFASYNQII